MTREEAIAKLKNFADHCYPNEEFLMAIQALQAQAENRLTAEQALDLAEKKAKQIKRELKPLADGKMCPICGSDSSQLCYVSKDDGVWAKCLRCGSRVLIKENGDLISRQAVDEIEELMTDINGDTVYAVRMSDIRQLSSVKPQEPKTGHWIGIDEEPHEDYECDVCGYVVSTWTANIKPQEEYKFCPNCGADMRGEQE